MGDAVRADRVLNVAGVVALMVLAQVWDVQLRVGEEASLLQPTFFPAVKEPLLVGRGLAGVAAVHRQLRAQGQVVLLVHGGNGSRNYEQ